MVLEILESSGLTVNAAKCEFRKTKLDFFGFTFSDKGVSCQDSKLNALAKAKEPSNANEVRSILG